MVRLQAVVVSGGELWFTHSLIHSFTPRLHSSSSSSPPRSAGHLTCCEPPPLGVGVLAGGRGSCVCARVSYYSGPRLPRRVRVPVPVYLMSTPALALRLPLLCFPGQCSRQLPLSVAPVDLGQLQLVMLLVGVGFLPLFPACFCVLLCCLGQYARLSPRSVDPVVDVLSPWGLTLLSGVLGLPFWLSLW